MHRAGTLLAGVAVALLCVPSVAQGPRRGIGGKRPQRAGGTTVRQVEVDGGNRRNDFEGTIWEYKIMENSDQNRSTRTKMTGQIRIKQSALFAIGGVKYTNNDKPNESKEGEETTEDPRAAIRARLQGGGARTSSGPGQSSGPAGGRLGGLRSSGGPLGGGQKVSAGERVGDLAKQKSNELQFRFDEDDSYPLSGRATIKPDKDNRGGTWIGSYDEFVDGKKKKRWRIEMRKIEE